jgi:WD40 repeat protein
MKISNWLNRKDPDTNRFVAAIKSPMYKLLGKFHLNIDNRLDWNDLFVSVNATDKLPCFDFRSRRKLKLHYYDSCCIVAESSKTLHIIHPEIGKSISFLEGLPEAMHIFKAESKGAILRSGNLITPGNLIGYLNFETGIVNVFSFLWQPFRTAIGKDFWLVGTRENPEGPGEIYCFSHNCDYLWGLRIKEEFQTAFGLVHPIAYHLKISKNRQEILVSSMDRLYRFSADGTLMARIAISELREADIIKMEKDKYNDLPKDPKTEMAKQWIGGMIRAYSLHSPLAGFAHDPLKDYLFILEPTVGRITAWDYEGSLIWVRSFLREDEYYINYGLYITWLDEFVFISFSSGQSFWIDREGKTFLSVKLPKGAEAIFHIPGQERYLIICQDGRRYEVDKNTKAVTQGPEGNRRMRLFIFQERMIFYDGYLWAAPPGCSWQTYHPKYINHTISTKELPQDQLPLLVKTDKPFRKVWTYKDPKNNPIQRYAFDRKKKRLYICKRKSVLSAEENRKEELAFRRGETFTRWNEVACYDFSLHQLWVVPVFSELTSLDVSPDGDSIFVGLWDHGLAYDPGKLVVLNANGNETTTLKTPSNPTYFYFINSDYGIFKGFDGSSLKIQRLGQGKWKIHQVPKSDYFHQGEFGTGLYKMSLGFYNLNRTGKKSYQISWKEILVDLKLNAAIYEAMEIPNSDNLLLRIGNRTLRALSPKIEAIWEIKTKGNIISVIKGDCGFLILLKQEILFISYEGKTYWKLGCPSNSYINRATWMRTHNAFLWETGDQDYYQIALISPDGKIIKSESFELLSKWKAIFDILANRGLNITEDENNFVLPFDYCIECYEIG